MRPLPPFPQAARGLRGPLEVIGFEPEPDGDAIRAGDYEESIRRIRVGTTFAPEYRWLVFYHELVHAALQDSGLHNLLKPKMQEALCDAIGSALLRYEFGDRLDPETPDAPEEAFL